MNSLNQYIQEKLKINSNSKIYTHGHITEQIINFLYCEPSDVSKEEFNIISNWVESNKIDYITVITTEEVLEGYGLIDEYNDVSLEDVKKMFENEYFKINIINKSLYNKYKEYLGELKWKDAYEHCKIYIYNYEKTEETILTFQSRMAGNILFYNKK